MRLKSLTVSGFRGFASRQEFDLAADATIVIGSNGLGKTSLFDAIQWGLSGRLGRLGDSDNSIVSLYSPDGQARVSLRLEENGDETVISRTFDGDSQTIRAEISGKPYKGASATARIFELFWPEAASANDGAVTFSTAISRSVYLQQDRLRDFLEGSTDKDRFDVISELVGAGRLTELQAQLESESRSWSRSTTQASKDLQPIRERVKHLQTQLADLERSAAIGSELDKSQWEEWWAYAKLIEVVDFDPPTPTSSNVTGLLDRALKYADSRRNQVRRKIAEIDAMIDFLRDKPNEVVSDLSELKDQLALATAAVEREQKQIDDARKADAVRREQQIRTKEESAQRIALAQLALRLLADKCPVCDQDYDVEKTRSRLLAIIHSGSESSDETVEPPASQMDLLTKRLNEAESVKATAYDAYRKASHRRKELERWTDECKERLASLGLDDESIADSLASAKQSTVSELDQLARLLKAGERLSLDVARIAASQMIEARKADLEKAQTELSNKEVVIKRREQTTIDLRAIIERLRSARSDVAVDKLREIEPLLQRIFARIDPHPTFRNVVWSTSLVRGKGRLDAEIRDDSEEKSSTAPETILSSSQLNALAVSIFLSFNLSLPNLPLNSAILDDPIQSLDEINLLGLVDLLRRTKDFRQILVSTHDTRYGHLLANKLRPADSTRRTSVIELRGWKRTGPDVLQYAVEPDQEQFRLAGLR